MPKSIDPKDRRLRVIPVNRKRIEVTFALERPEAQEVFLCGDFNDWSPSSLRMIRSSQNGLWEKRLALAPGRYEYKFVADGEWIHDPHADQNVPNAGGSLNSVVEVGM
jgi:1,4-alpha-glucan branching enzyme